MAYLNEPSLNKRSIRVTAIIGNRRNDEDSHERKPGVNLNGETIRYYRKRFFNTHCSIRGNIIHKIGVAERFLLV